MDSGNTNNLNNESDTKTLFCRMEVKDEKNIIYYNLFINDNRMQ